MISLSENEFNWNDTESAWIWEKDRSNSHDHIVEELEQMNVDFLVDCEDIVEEHKDDRGNHWSDVFENTVDHLSSILRKNETKLHLVEVLHVEHFSLGVYLLNY